ncbi:MAG: hypothetical protein FWE57_04870 [Chitinispirillia bacterium]|nr:hypothetical protein [Chitinispirillia bacterium]
MGGSCFFSLFKCLWHRWSLWSDTNRFVSIGITGKMVLIAADRLARSDPPEKKRQRVYPADCFLGGERRASLAGAVRDETARG